MIKEVPRKWGSKPCSSCSVDDSATRWQMYRPHGNASIKLRNHRLHSGVSFLFLGGPQQCGVPFSARTKRGTLKQGHTYLSEGKLIMAMLGPWPPRVRANETCCQKRYLTQETYGYVSKIRGMHPHSGRAFLLASQKDTLKQTRQNWDGTDRVWLAPPLSQKNKPGTTQTKRHGKSHGNAFLQAYGLHPQKASGKRSPPPPSPKTGDPAARRPVPQVPQVPEGPEVPLPQSRRRPWPKSLKFSLHRNPTPKKRQTSCVAPEGSGVQSFRAESG